MVEDKLKLFLIGDELSLKAMSQTYKKFKTLVYGKLRLQLLDEPLHHFGAWNATPVSDREQVYNWCSIFNHPSYPLEATVGGCPCPHP